MGQQADIATGIVVSADGTRIGYRRFGREPSVILLHGGVNASQHMMELGRWHADAFTVYLPDRRGRGMSGARSSDSGRRTSSAHCLRHRHDL
jgi:pimeloyl-ACP methyl ester carboxylesterase